MSKVLRITESGIYETEKNRQNGRDGSYVIN